MMNRNHQIREENEWVKKANCVIDFLVSEHSNGTTAPIVEPLWMPATWNDEQMCRLRNSGMVGLITVTGCGRAALLGERAKQMHLPHLAIVHQNCEHMASFFGDRDSMFASYIEVKDVEVIITRMKDHGFTHILVLYDEKFALYGLELLKRQAERTNLTFSFLRLIPDWSSFKKSIKTIFERQAEKNSLYTGFGVLVFSNYTCAEKLEADKIMDPNIVLVVFYNGWDQNLSHWYYTHGISYPYEKLIYVVVRSFPKRIMHRMKRASRLLNGKYHVVSLYLLSLPLSYAPPWTAVRNSNINTPCGTGAITRLESVYKIMNFFLTAFYTALIPGGVHLPAASSARIILGFWWLYVLVVMAYYSSNLIAFLTVPEIRWIVSSFENAVDREDLHIYIPYGTGLHQEILTQRLTCALSQNKTQVVLVSLILVAGYDNHAEYTHPCIRDYSMHAQGSSRPIGVRELEGVFLLLLLGTAISLITMPVELLVGLKLQREKMDEIFQQTTKKKLKTPAVIDLHKGWKPTQVKDSWTTVGPGGRFMTDWYPDFGRFGRRPIYIKELPPFPHFQAHWKDAAELRKIRDHVVVIAN
ncbi:unnamed protein product, partial [Ixodes pacificus]